MAAEAEAELERGNEYPAHYKVMMDKLNEQRQLDQFTDITLIVDGELALNTRHLNSRLCEIPNQRLLRLSSLLQDTSSEPIKQCWQHAVSSSIRSFKISPRSLWWRLKVFCALIRILIKESKKAIKILLLWLLRYGSELLHQKLWSRGYTLFFHVEQLSLTNAALSHSGVSNTAFSQLMEFTYTATLVIVGEEEANDVWKAAEYLQMHEAIKALNVK